MSEPQIVLTDPRPLPRDERCPQCHAGEEHRVPSCGFGQPHPVCRKCGYAFPVEADRD